MAQIKFVPGYFVDNNGQKTECLINYEVWKNNPQEFSYKLPGAGNLNTLGLINTKEFALVVGDKYIRATVNIDRSGEQSLQKAPEWSRETVFLRVLVEGKASLYEFRENKLHIFYCQIDGGEIEALVYKKYLGQSGETLVNSYYQQQLNFLTKCDNFSNAYFERLSYNTAALKEHFLRYSRCQGGEATVLSGHSKAKTLFFFKSKAGLELARQVISNYLDFGWNPTVHVGVELELLLPVDQNVLSLFLEPNYQSFDAEVGYNTEMKYRSVQIPLGLRYYIPFDEYSRFFFEGAVVYDIEQTEISGTKANNTYTAALGMGYSFAQRYSAQFRYAFPRNIFSDIPGVESKFEQIGLIVGYRF